jgi:transposase
VLAKPKGGDTRSHRIETYREAILGAIEGQKDITLAELAALLVREHALPVAPSTVHRFLLRHRITLKKVGARERAGAPGRGAAPPSLVQQPA